MTITPQEIAKHYTDAGDSVTLINELVALSSRNDQQVDDVRRNVEHLQIMVAKDYWTTEDLAPFNAAIAAGTAVLPTE
mgnify:CR=1 FL=1|jgi:hypothetical protein|tara:strand:- start:45 stop:278 length:234 start_codon:yes stop_codon:yes gene_type:complete